MENIEARAKYQLLNLQENYDNFQSDTFPPNSPPTREKPKSRTSARVITSLSSHREFPNFQTQNNKQILKDKLKKLLEKDFQMPEQELKRIRTICSLQSVKNSGEKPNLLKIYRNENNQKLRTLEIGSNSSLGKPNLSGSKKSLNLQETKDSKQNTISIFEKENEQIRKFIKRKMEQKAIDKQRKLILTAGSSNIRKESLQNFKMPICEKSKTLQNQKLSKAQKVKILAEKKLENLSRKENLISRKTNKQNHQDLTELSTPLIAIKKQKNYEGRKLRNILF